MRLTLDEIKVAASAIRALPKAAHSNVMVGFCRMDEGQIPCRCAAQAIWEFRFNKPAGQVAETYGDRQTKLDTLADLCMLLAAMGHIGKVTRYGDILDALPYLEAIITAAEARPCVPVSPSEAYTPSVSSPILEESLMV